MTAWSNSHFQTPFPGIPHKYRLEKLNSCFTKLSWRQVSQVLSTKYKLSGSFVFLPFFLYDVWDTPVICHHEVNTVLRCKTEKLERTWGPPWHCLSHFISARLSTSGLLIPWEKRFPICLSHGSMGFLLLEAHAINKPYIFDNSISSLLLHWCFGYR